MPFISFRSQRRQFSLPTGTQDNCLFAVPDVCTSWAPTDLFSSSATVKRDHIMRLDVPNLGWTSVSSRIPFLY